MTESFDREPEGEGVAAHHGLETRILRGSIWLGLGFGSRQIATWLGMLVLVRLLEPDAFGLVALALTIISAIEFLRGAGVWAALVHRRTEIEEAAASALVYWVIASFGVYAVCFWLAPVLASAFHAPELTSVLRVLAIVTVFGALSGVPAAILERELAYAISAKVDLGAAAAQLGTAIGLAAAGAGVWSLVGGQLVAAGFESAALWYFVPWRPSPRKASWSMLRELSHYARFAGVWNIAMFVKGTADTICVGRILGTTAVGFYSVAFRLATSADSVLNQVILRGLFPAFSMVHRDREVFRGMFVRHMQRMVLVVLPTSIFLAMAARPVVLVVLGQDWSLIVTSVRILAIAGFVSSLSATCSSVFRGAGRPDLAMRYAVANVALLVPGLIVLIKELGIEGAALAVLLALSITTLPALVRTVRLVGVSAGDLEQRIRPGLLCSGDPDRRSRGPPLDDQHCSTCRLTSRGARRRRRRLFRERRPPCPAHSRAHVGRSPWNPHVGAARLCPCRSTRRRSSLPVEPASRRRARRTNRSVRR